MATAPLVSIRDKNPPYPVINSLAYVQSVLGGNNLPVAGSEISNLVYFRVYNNYTKSTGIATMINVFITVFDGGSPASHTGMQSPASQSWVRIYENGFGENSQSPGLYTQFLGQDTPIGKSQADTYYPEFGSDGTPNNYIRAGTDTNGVGFIEFATYVETPDVIGFQSYAPAVSIQYDWHV
jgi:hypothetical protein